MTNNIRPIAFYLPQYHPIPENDEWWGKGFTEWTNVTKAKPLFKGHHQPNLPGELGFYDLRVSEVREQQAALAKEYGIEGFMYWHYWFAGKRILERPFQEVLESGKPDFPFCLGWANESWKGNWHGLSAGEMLIEQTYPGVKDYEKHFYAVLPALKDKRYMTIDSKPIFYIYRPFEIPDSKIFIDTWRKLAKKNGLTGIYFIALSYKPDKEYQTLLGLGFDAMNSYRLSEASAAITRNSIIHCVKKKILNTGKKNTIFGIFEYRDFIKYLISPVDAKENIYPSLIPNWDNSPRAGRKSRIIQNSTPDLFRKHIKEVLEVIRKKQEEHRIIFIKSWNEWAEGNYLEPDQKFGRKYLEVLKEEIEKFAE
jgi:hypothetical protein